MAPLAVHIRPESGRRLHTVGGLRCASDGNGGRARCREAWYSAHHVQGAANRERVDLVSFLVAIQPEFRDVQTRRRSRLRCRLTMPT